MIALGQSTPVAAARGQLPGGAGGVEGVRTYVFSPKGKNLGYVERTGVREWSASEGGNSEIYADRKGGYSITEGFHPVAYAWPKPSGQRSYYRVLRACCTPTGDTLRRASATRWNIFRGTRLIAFTRGPDGIAAGLAYTIWGDNIL